MSNGKVCLLQNGDLSISIACLLPVMCRVCLPPWGRPGTGGLGWRGSTRKPGHAKLSSPFLYVFLHQILSFNQIISFLFPLKNKIRAPLYIRLLHQTSKLLSSPLCFSLPNMPGRQGDDIIGHTSGKLRENKMKRKKKRNREMGNKWSDVVVQDTDNSNDANNRLPA